MGVAVFFVSHFFYRPSIDYRITSSHPYIQSGSFNKDILDDYLETIGFINTEVLYAVREKIRVKQSDLQVIEFVFTDQPQLRVLVEGPNGEEVVSITHNHNKEKKLLQIILFLNPQVLRENSDATRSLNYQIMSALYSLRYLDYYEYIGNRQYDFYGTINKEVMEFLEIQEPVAQYVFSF